jgi:hypothetical protein
MVISRQAGQFGDFPFFVDDERTARSLRRLPCSDRLGNPVALCALTTLQGICLNRERCLNSQRRGHVKFRHGSGQEVKDAPRRSALRYVVAAMIVLPLRPSSRYSASAFPTTYLHPLSKENSVGGHVEFWPNDTLDIASLPPRIAMKDGKVAALPCTLH